jgi:hypothetical protein
MDGQAVEMIMINPPAASGSSWLRFIRSSIRCSSTATDFDDLCDLSKDYILYYDV